MKRTRLRALMSAAFAAAALGAMADNLGDKPASSPAPEWMDNAVIYEANLRQGTPERSLKGLQRELPRLRDLGVDIVWLMPVHPISEKNRKGTLGSYYAVRDYKAVNPEFGTLDDLRELVRTAHSLGMKVILDEVCNHTGCDNAWVSEHPDYYALNEQGEMYGPFDWTDTYKLDYSNPATRAAMIDALTYWLREADIDGYRCDVAGEVPTDFWEQARPALQAVKPVFMLAEASKPELLLKAFDADYAWPMKDVFNAIAHTQGVNKYAASKGHKLTRTTARDIEKLLERQQREYPAGAVHMNMVTNHDLNSWEGTEWQRFGPGLGAFTVLEYTLPGMPMIYTGQEVGMDHAFEFFEIDNGVPVYIANDMTVFLEMLNGLKHSHPALNARAAVKFHPLKGDDIIAYTRTQGGDAVTVVANLSDRPARLSFKGDAPSVAGMTDWFTRAEAALPAELAPWQYVVLTK